jgi:hypothetical protein
LWRDSYDVATMFVNWIFTEWCIWENFSSNCIDTLYIFKLINNISSLPI